MPQHSNLMPRKHSNSVGAGLCHPGIEPADQLATLFCQDASYLPPVGLHALTPDETLTLEPIHQSGDGRRPLHHSGGDFQRG